MKQLFDVATVIILGAIAIALCVFYDVYLWLWSGVQ